MEITLVKPEAGAEGRYGRPEITGRKDKRSGEYSELHFAFGREIAFKNYRINSMYCAILNTESGELTGPRRNFS